MYPKEIRISVSALDLASITSEEIDAAVGYHELLTAEDAAIIAACRRALCKAAYKRMKVKRSRCGRNRK